MTAESDKTGPGRVRDLERDDGYSEAVGDGEASPPRKDGASRASDLARRRLALNDRPQPFRACPPRPFGQR